MGISDYPKSFLTNLIQFSTQKIPLHHTSSRHICDPLVLYITAVWHSPNHASSSSPNSWSDFFSHIPSHAFSSKTGCRRFSPLGFLFLRSSLFNCFFLQRASRVYIRWRYYFDLMNRTSHVNESGYTLHSKEGIKRNGQQFINARNGLWGSERDERGLGWGRRS